jgi:predicted nucleic acid-binding protein
LADTSVFIGLEAARFDVIRFENFEWGVSAIALGELRLGVLKYRACTFSLESSCL